eukprot:759579-Hanusia_phi.AAC.6
MPDSFEGDRISAFAQVIRRKEAWRLIDSRSSPMFGIFGRRNFESESFKVSGEWLGGWAEHAGDKDELRRREEGKDTIRSDEGRRWGRTGQDRTGQDRTGQDRRKRRLMKAVMGLKQGRRRVDGLRGIRRRKRMEAR